MGRRLFNITNDYDENNPAKASNGSGLSQTRVTIPSIATDSFVFFSCSVGEQKVVNSGANVNDGAIIFSEFKIKPRDTKDMYCGGVMFHQDNFNPSFGAWRSTS